MITCNGGLTCGNDFYPLLNSKQINNLNFYLHTFMFFIFPFGFTSRRNALRLYSLLKLSTGFANAAFIAWKLTVIKVIISAPNPEKIKTQNEIVVL